MSLNNRIRVYRAEHHLSQSDLAAKIGVSRKTISTIEVGKYIPSTVIALKIARYFGVAVEEIFALAEQESNEPINADQRASNLLPGI